MRTFIFERVGKPDFFLQSLRPAAFVTGLWTNPTNSNSELRSTYANVGGQFDLRFSVLHWYEMTLSAGYAVGFRNSQRTGGEWMLSLKIL